MLLYIGLSSGIAMTFDVRKTSCETCIYRRDSPFDIEELEDMVRDPSGHGFAGFRICHHSKSLCCRGFWNRHKDEFPLGQVAQRLGMVKFVREDGLFGN